MHFAHCFGACALLKLGTTCTTRNVLYTSNDTDDIVEKKMEHQIAQEFLTTPEMARATGVTLTHLFNLLRAGRLEGEKVNGRWRIPRAAVEAYQFNRRPQPRAIPLNLIFLDHKGSHTSGINATGAHLWIHSRKLGAKVEFTWDNFSSGFNLQPDAIEDLAMSVLTITGSQKNFHLNKTFAIFKVAIADAEQTKRYIAEVLGNRNNWRSLRDASLPSEVIISETTKAIIQ